MDVKNKRIVKNTIVNYIGLLINTILGFLVSRYVLMALGASDFGLYGVVGGLIAMLNVVSTAMTTTTRRYINVEMGKADGNPNKIFNVCLIVHIAFAVFVLLVAETIGIFYINNYLNVVPEKLSDAHFVFQVSTIAAAIGITNVPYQALVEAFERFDLSVGLKVFSMLLRLILVICLLFYCGNVLRVYAVGISLLSIITFVFYRWICYRFWSQIVFFKLYKQFKLYKEILIFNNYTAIGAFAYNGRTQGSQMIVNYFFGTLVNAAFQIAYTIENYCSVFVGNIGRAAWPQITQSYSGGDYDRTTLLTESMAKYTILLTLTITVPIYVEIEFLLSLWLKNVPEGAVFLCKLTLIDAVVRSLCSGTNALVQASGKVKWFQLTDSIVSILTLPVAFVCYKFGCPQETIIYLYIISNILVRIISFALLKCLIKFDILHFVKNVYYPTFTIIFFSVIFERLYGLAEIEISYMRLIGILITLVVVIVLNYLLGFNKTERKMLLNLIKKK